MRFTIGIKQDNKGQGKVGDALAEGIQTNDNTCHPKLPCLQECLVGENNFWLTFTAGTRKQ